MQPSGTAADDKEGKGDSSSQGDGQKEEKAGEEVKKDAKVHLCPVKTLPRLV